MWNNYFYKVHFDKTSIEKILIISSKVFDARILDVRIFKMLSYSLRRKLISFKTFDEVTTFNYSIDKIKMGQKSTDWGEVLGDEIIDWGRFAPVRVGYVVKLWNLTMTP